MKEKDSTLKINKRRTNNEQDINEIKNSFIREEVLKIRCREHEIKAKEIAQQIIDEWCYILDPPKLSLVKEMQKHAGLSGRNLVDIIGQKNNEILFQAIEASNRIESFYKYGYGW